MAENEAPTEDLMDVITNAIETGDIGSANPPEETNNDDTENLDGGGEDDLAGADDSTGTDESEGEEGASEEASESVEQKRGPDGKFLKPGEKQPEIDPNTGKPKVEAKKPDPLNDPIPKDLKQETQDRIRTLIKTTREATQAQERAQGNFDEIIKGIQATGTTPEQYREVLSFMSLFNSGDTAQQEKALELIEGVADRLATLLGKERTVNDVLAQHQDLREAVAAGKIAPQYAKEIARTRNAQGFRTELNGVAQRAQDEQRARAADTATARTQLNELEATLKATDPDYERKKAYLVPILQTIFPSTPPREWAAKFQEAYKRVTLPAAGRVASKVPNRQPMRAGGSVGNGKTGSAGKNSGGMGQESGSMLDAVNDALASMPR